MVRAALLLGALLLGGAVAHAQPSAFESMAQSPMPFVAASGVVEKTLKFSDLTNTLGQAETDVTRPMSYENGKKRGDDRIVTYKARGMIFVIEREARKSMDPVVSTMTVTAPSRTQLPNGLYMGMPYDRALPIIERSYHVDKAYKTGSQPWFNVTDKADDTDRNVHISFTDDKLAFMMFTTRDPPSLLQRVKQWIGMALMLVLMSAVAWVFYQVRGNEDEDEREPSRVGEILRYTIAALLVVGGGTMAAIGVSSFGSSDPYGRMAGLIALLAGLGGLFYAALLLSGARNKAVSIIASAVILLVVVASVAGKFLH